MPSLDAPVQRAGAAKAAPLVNLRSEAFWGTFVLAAVTLLCLLGPLLWQVDPLKTNILGSLEPPTLAHPFGTDDVGRDVFARFMAGGRYSLFTAALVVVISTVIGGALGLAGGYFGGWTDKILSRIMDAILSFPPLILAMAVAIGLGAGLWSAVAGIVLASIPWFFRLLRSEVLRIRTLTFVDAMRALGASQTRIMFRHIMPQLSSTLLTQASSVFGFSVLTLAGLGFVGLGIQPPAPEWGTMITEGLAYALTGQWWLGLFPGFGLFMLTAAGNMVADGLRDRFDPRAQRRR